jgi:methylated-DNA-[protein]-cysteine S-methyltransferase
MIAGESRPMNVQTMPTRQERYCLFDTAIGPCGIAWTEQGLTRLQLPESDRAATEKRLRSRSGRSGPHVPPPPIAQVIAEVRRYMAGERVDFFAAAVDLMGVVPLHRQIYDALRSVGWGHTTTYGALARQLGLPDAREVGQAMARNPVPLIIPCHRVLASGDRLGGFSAPGGAFTKERLLALEGVSLDGGAPRLPGL